MSTCKICGGEYARLRTHLRVHQIDPINYWVKCISETHEVPHCLNCGKLITTFTNDSINEGPSAYCSKKCMDEDLPRVLKERHEEGIYEGTSYLINTWNTDIELRNDSLARTSYRRLLRNSDPFSEGYLYVVLIENDSIKFGATRQNLSEYLHLRYHYFSYNLLASYKGTLISVAGIEYLIKTSNRFKSYLIEGYVSTTEELDPIIKESLIDYLDSIPRLERMY